MEILGAKTATDSVCVTVETRNRIARVEN